MNFQKKKGLDVQYFNFFYKKGYVSNLKKIQKIIGKKNKN